MNGDNVKERVLKAIMLFDSSVAGLKLPDNAPKETRKVVELSKMYASDARSFLEKGDIYTAFASIEYAHGLLDAIRELNGQGYGSEK